MPEDKLEALGNTQAPRRTVLKGLLVGLGAGVLVQAAGGVTAFARSEQEKPGGDEKTAKKLEKAKEGEGGKKLENADKTEHAKIEKNKNEQGKEAKGKGTEKKKMEEPKAQHKK